VLNDIEKTLFHEQTILSRIDELAAQITEDYRDKELMLPLKLDCLSVSSYHGGTESSGTVTFDQLSLPDIAGRHVLIVDDILDSGRTLHAICERLWAESQPLSIRLCVLLQKRIQRAKELHADYVGFEIGNEFVIGYGLDYQEKYRNLPFIGTLRM